MGDCFFKKTKEWAISIKRKNITVSELYHNMQDNHLPEWLKIIIQMLTTRIFKVKEIKEGKLISYIMKLFETAEEDNKKGPVVAERNGMTYFIDFLLELLK